jgi:hypothetical protein
VVHHMRSTRLALISVAVGAALLGWATAGVSAVAGDLAKATDRPAEIELHHDRDHPHRGGGRRGGV